MVNTAGGLGGPRGATRGHEKTVRFPDPHADAQVLAALRQRLWQARDPSSRLARVVLTALTQEPAATTRATHASQRQTAERARWRGE